MTGHFCTRCRNPVVANACGCTGSPSPWAEYSTPRWRYGATYLTDLEGEVYELFQRVEHMGAHPLLTDASCALMKARDALVAWADAGKPGRIEKESKESGS